MKKYFVLMILIILSIIISASFNQSGSVLEYRIEGAIITVILVVVTWVCMWKDFFKSESIVKKENMSLRYNDISNKQLKHRGIDSLEFKEMIFNKFKGILLAISNYDKNFLKDNLSKDLYHSYVDEMDKIRGNNQINVFKDIELKNIKIYGIKDEYNVLSVNIYLNVIMFDYIANKDSLECVEYNSNVKREFEFEVIFIKNKITDSEFVMSKKTCINDMDIAKKDK